MDVLFNLSKLKIKKKIMSFYNIVEKIYFVFIYKTTLQNPLESYY
jgi:hypothetical protein